MVPQLRKPASGLVDNSANITVVVRRPVAIAASEPHLVVDAPLFSFSPDPASSPHATCSEHPPFCGNGLPATQSRFRFQPAEGHRKGSACDVARGRM
ncbi:hypothetical protein BDM02DRAFT_3114294 [Thelephora ganbajun]|uniref:Uncharacterized protein n=1 Tax=Thelephora ganbajun TaxID=370292 RepID=A0ACB6ZI70_THEGA|nr:hypothetical protein BDM02DRAFT_3114294 [Thelephora ganbajun]